MKDEDLFKVRSTELGRLDNDTLNMKVGDLTVRELVRILRMVKSNRAPVVVRTDIRERIKKFLMEHPEGSTVYTMSKEMNVDYGNLKKTMTLMHKKDMLEQTKGKDENLRDITVYKWKDQQMMN
jgi:hypothetical protein